MLSIDTTAGFVGHACWVERRCFETLGAWVPSVAEPEAKLALARHSRHHGWHAQLLGEVLPATRAHDPARLVAPADPGWRDVLAVVAEATTTLDRLVGVYQALLPSLVSTYDEVFERTSDWSDGPVARRVRLVVDDERSDLAEGLSLLERLFEDGAADRAAPRRAAVDAVLAGR
jgi:hypothetical protein